MLPTKTTGLMGLLIYDRVCTSVGDPEGRVTVKIFFRNARELELRIEHVGDPPTDKHANYGVKVVYDVSLAARLLPKT